MTAFQKWCECNFVTFILYYAFSLVNNQHKLEIVGFVIKNSQTFHNSKIKYDKISIKTALKNNIINYNVNFMDVFAGDF